MTRIPQNERATPDVSQPSVHFSRPVRRLSLLVAILISFTSSFDIFLVLNAGGNFRFCQIISPVLITLAILKMRWRRPIPTLGGFSLAIWLGFQCAFIPVTDFWPKSLGYCLWLSLNIALVFSYVQLFGDWPEALKSMLRWYVYSFAAIAGFGILQFALPLLGLPGLFVTQWWVEGSLPRVNGFSYEPSYFATYLLIGFVFVSSLRRARSTLLSSGVLTLVYWLTLVGIVVSSSRMGIVFLAVDIALIQLAPWLSLLKDFGRLRIDPRKLRALRPSVVFALGITVITASAGLALQQYPAAALMFLVGTGLGDTPAHSVLEREGSFEETLTVFRDHPFIGRSLGGVSSGIADLDGVKIHSFEESKDHEGMSVFAEVLAASGVIGFIPFVWFLVNTIWKPLRLAAITLPFYSAVLRALVRSLIFTWAILQFNQNLLRPYLWVHVAVLASVYAAARQLIRTRAVAAKDSL
jgi:hypothetical protein